MTEPDDTERGTSVLDRERAARDAASSAALARYRRRMRRQRAVYYPVVGAIVLGLVIAFVVAYLHGEAHNTRLITVADAPPTLQTQHPASGQHRIWRTGDRAAIGDPQYRGTVVVWGQHTMRGVNARTGRQTWSYYRSDRTICTAAQIDGYAIAVYELAGNCDEITALNAGTGRRAWTRTLDFNGLPVYGRPAFQADVADSTLMITTSAEIYSINIAKVKYGGGENHFTYSHFGCHINSAVLGSQGALISQTCAKPRCGTLKFCGKGPQLLLRGDTSEDVNSDSTTNPNRIMWNVLGDTDVPVSAAGVLAAGNRTTGELDQLGLDSGKPTGSVDLGVSGAAWSGHVAAVDNGDGDVVWVGGRAALVRTDDTTPVWITGSQGPPTSSGATVVVSTTSGAARVLAGRTGRVQADYPLSPAAPKGSTVYRLGAGFLVDSAAGTVAYS